MKRLDIGKKLRLDESQLLASPMKFAETDETLQDLTKTNKQLKLSKSHLKRLLYRDGYNENGAAQEYAATASELRTLKTQQGFRTTKQSWNDKRTRSNYKTLRGGNDTFGSWRGSIEESKTQHGPDISPFRASLGQPKDSIVNVGEFDSSILDRTILETGHGSQGAERGLPSRFNNRKVSPDRKLTTILSNSIQEVGQNETVKQQLADYLQELEDLRSAQEMLAQNPEVQKLLQDKDLKFKTDLSPFTLLENSVVNVTSSKVGETTQVAQPAEARGSCHELLERTNLKLRMAEYNLQRLLDTGEFHVQLTQGGSGPIQMYAGVPTCFKIATADFEFPIVMKFEYLEAGNTEMSAYASHQTLTPNDANYELKQEH